MRRTMPAQARSAAQPLPGAPEQDHTGGPGEGTSGAGRDTLRTEFPFELPRGYVDESGTVHRHGVMRLATARDELIPLRDDRVRENSAYLSVVLIARVITRLGTIEDVHAGIVEDLFASDLAFLQDFYRRINAEGHTRAAVTCPSCQEHFAVDLAGGRLGES
ncbi:hypothetical protein ACFYWX_33740 [Streptomyces sp. NPDC002888]|uniref:hypothetical protein n=1 Tax=Streptomyces sp. NPDC002888 TaxID=3364668 RepID=UPI00369FCE3E